MDERDIPAAVEQEEELNSVSSQEVVLASEQDESRRETDAAAQDAEEEGSDMEDEAGCDVEPVEAMAEVTADQLQLETQSVAEETDESRLKAIVEAVVYVTEEPVSAEQIAKALDQPADKVKALLDELVAEYEKPHHGLTIREVAGGFKMATKAEHHDAIRAFVKSLRPPLKLSLAALETLAVIAYKQPVTAPEIMEIRGVQGVGVLKTLLDRKLITTAGRKQVVGKPILYKTNKEFLVQFGLNNLGELPTLKEFEELRRMALSDEPEALPAQPGEPAAGSAQGAEALSEGTREASWSEVAELEAEAVATSDPESGEMQEIAQKEVTPEPDAAGRESDEEAVQRVKPSPKQENGGGVIGSAAKEDSAA